MLRVFPFVTLMVSLLSPVSPLTGQETSALRGDTASPFLPPPPGPLVIIGGGRLAENEAVYRAILDRRSGQGPVCVIPTANDDVPTAMARGVRDLDRYGGEGTAIGLDLGLHNAQRAFDGDLAAALRSCSGFFFEGGQQHRILEVFRPGGADTPAYHAILGRFREGAVVAGTSAGAAMMSGVMIRGGNSRRALQSGVGAPESGAGVYRQPGMRFLRGAIIDQHFLARGRVGRLLVALLESPAAPVGVGVDEQTALVIDSARARVVGTSAVVLFDVRASVRRATGGAGDAVRMEFLADGDGVDLLTGVVFRDSEKHLLPPDLGSITVVENMFEPFAFLRMVTTMARTPVASLTVRVGEGRWIRISKESAFQAVSRNGLSSYTPFDSGISAHLSEMPAGFSAGPWCMSLVRGTR